MNRKNKNTTDRDEHLEALGPLLTQLRTHLTASSEKKGTYGDYLRLLEFYREVSAGEVAQIFVGWVENETLESEP